MKPYGTKHHGQLKNHSYPHGPSCPICANAARRTRWDLPGYDRVVKFTKAQKRAMKKAARRWETGDE